MTEAGNAAPPSGCCQTNENCLGSQAQKLGDFPIAISSVSSDQHRHVVDQSLFVVRPLGASALRRSMLPEHAANPPLPTTMAKPLSFNARDRGAVQTRQPGPRTGIPMPEKSPQILGNPLCQAGQRKSLLALLSASVQIMI